MRRRGLTISVFVSAIGLQLCAPDPGAVRAAQLREQILRTCAEADPRSSEAACRQIVSEAARDDDSWNTWIDGLGSEILVTRLAAAAEKTRNHEGAMSLWRLATQRYPENPDYHYRLGRILVDEIGAYEEAYGPLLRATSQKAGFVEALLPLGYVQRRMQRPADAMATYQTVLQLSPRSVEARIGLAEALEDTRSYSAAFEQLQQAVGPGLSDALAVRRRILLANAQLWLGRGPQAQATLRARSSERSSPHAQQLDCASATIATLLGDDAGARRSCSGAEGSPLCGCSALTVGELADRLPAFTDAEAAVALAALAATARAGAESGTLVIAEIAGFGLASGSPLVRDAVAAHVRAGAQGRSAALKQALDRLLEGAAPRKRIRFPPRPRPRGFSLRRR